MTAKELAIELNGRDTGEEMEWGEAQDAKAAGLVVVYGYSDDNVELCGAINDEVGAYSGTTVYLTPDGVLQEPDCGQNDCRTLPGNGKRPRPSRPCGMTREAPAGRSRRTSRMRRSPSWRTGSHSVWELCSVWRIWR